MSGIGQVRVLTLNKDENRETTLYRLQKGWNLRFILGSSLQTAPVRLFCNHPPNKDVSFDRNEYEELEFKSATNMKSDRHDYYADVSLICAGSFNYYFTIDNSSDIKNTNGLGYFLVDPCIQIGPNDEEINLDCLQCQTVVTKLLGPFAEWEDRLLVAKESGYNLIHFTPTQELGISNSAYSIRDQRHFSPAYGDQYTYNDIDALVQKMKVEWEVLSLTDLVYNHTSIDSPWLQEHPDCAFNLENSPHLRPAYIMDRALLEFSDQVAEGKWEYRGISATINDEEQLQIIRDIIVNEILPAQKLHEFWCIDVEKCVKEFKHNVEANTISTTREAALVIKQDPMFRRLRSTVDMNTALRLYNTDHCCSQVFGNKMNMIDQDEERPAVFSRQERINKCCTLFRDKLLELNAVKEFEIIDHIDTAAKNYIANGRWRFLANDGPKLQLVTKEHPIMHEYFVWPRPHNGGVQIAEQMLETEAQYVMACNGWVMGDNPLKSFAEEDSNVYLRRELIEWGDSVKLRYGEKPEDCPFLWNLMEEYTKITAKIFPGIRLDNCHSTPIHVAEYMLDVARTIRPDLYVVAELFTGAEHVDNIFINRLGINSLIRESMSAWDAHEEGRLVHRYGGIPVGSFVQPRVRPLVPNVAHALFYDQTHDNPSPVLKRSPYDLWPSSAIVSMACCAIGSNRGYDQLVPHHIHIVKEERLYTAWTSSESEGPMYISLKSGITAGKKVLNQLHYEMGRHGFNQVYVDQLDGNVVSITRHNPQTHECIVLVARTSFQHPSSPNETGYIRPIVIQGVINEVVLEGSMVEVNCCKYEADDRFINGLPDYKLELKTHIQVEESEMVTVTQEEKGVEVTFVKFTPGSVIAFRTNLSNESRMGILDIRRGVGQFGYIMRSYSGSTIYDESCDVSKFRSIVSKLTLADLNVVLYRSSPEEEADGYGSKAYEVPGLGQLAYCGIRGVISVLNDLRPTNDLGHPFCDNLRSGPWLPEYVSKRLLAHESTLELAKWFEEIFAHLENVPSYLVPCYFDAIITGAYVVLREMAIQLLSDFVKDGSTFVQSLAMGSIQFCGFVRNSKLPPLSKDFKPELRIERDVKTGEELVAPLSMAAGFPHFCAGYMRNWGRDTFIAVPGLLLITERFDEARCLILAYAGCLRHGLIPNLLNEGTGARYNCRDAVWWWLQCIQDYCKMAPDGYQLLCDPVSRMYPTDDSEAQFGSDNDMPLHDVIQEALQRHAEGIRFVERNAGPMIDNLMQQQGFTVEAGIRWDTGFVYGGNEFNCGTWMDKMGSSETFGLKGVPATPRDGSAVEIVGLCMSAVSWLDMISEKGTYPYTTVKANKDGGRFDISFKEWANLIQDNFEKCFWVKPKRDPTNPEAHLVHRRGIYKDSYRATLLWPDYQLRPNFTIAMVVAPQLFTPENAWFALEMAQNILLGPLGMKTLDPRDWAYRGFYDNATDSDDRAALGFSYHQGPEWVWPIGFFLRAKLKFASLLETSRPGVLLETVHFVQSSLSRHYKEIIDSPWQSLPEMTNADGAVCPFSCRAQAWSVSSVLVVLHYLEQLQKTD
ncbi:glycogen debranching enzyme-like isoform X2 [Gigantopelta aegis]|uniref:glycogen debranching enzyme-like isoform X2 n=1 Tax=Gigantopelta aegis TaxID=1735272 RepID=UPI001B88CB0E|nr:glycogen debranching enzyme-like isoform X2 [Gigantopelta aegis]